MKILLTLSLSLILLNSCISANDGGEIIIGAERIEYYLPFMEDASVGVLANHTSMIGESHLVDTLLSRGVDIVRIFSPEHGFRGKADAGEHISNETDPRTGLPIVSLYGNRRKPLLSDMDGLDIIVFDIQDVGARFYTYISSLQYLMERAAESGVKIIILDRPNPNGNYVDGPVLEPEFKSFVGMQAIPVVHGMTVGEYAMMINSEGLMEEGIRCDLKIVSCLNYTHSTAYNLPVAPSPNLPNQTSVYLYPSICFFEGTVFSCGRGTDKPFQVFGHPAYPLKEFAFVPTSGSGAATPKLEDEECYGLDLSNSIESGLVPNEALNLDWIIEAYRLFPEKDKFFNSYFNTLAGNDKLKQQIIDGQTSEQIRLSWQDDLNLFKQVRSKYLLYE